MTLDDTECFSKVVEGGDGSGSDGKWPDGCLLQKRRLSCSLSSLSTLALQFEARKNSSNNQCSMCSGCDDSAGDYRLCRSVEHILHDHQIHAQSPRHHNAKDHMNHNFCELNTLDLTNTATYSINNKKLAKLISETSDYVSSDNSPDFFNNNPCK